jgi:hypothetical protein
MPSGLLLLPLIGGYFFLTLCNRTRFSFRKQEGHRLYLNAAALGIVLLILARLITQALAHSRWGEGLYDNLRRFAPFDFAGAAVGSLVLGFLLPWLFNLQINEESTGIPLRENRLQTLKGVARKTDELLSLFLDAQEERHPVLVFLENGKAYVGYVLTTAHLAPELPYIKLVPTVSGFRTKDELELELTNIYTESKTLMDAVWSMQATPQQQERLRRLQIVLKREKILSANFFNEDVYLEHRLRRMQRAAGRPKDPRTTPDRPVHAED